MFPFFILGGLLIKAQIAVVAGGLDVALLCGGADGAARFFAVGAVVELAGAQKGGKIREGVLEVLL